MDTADNTTRRGRDCQAGHAEPIAIVGIGCRFPGGVVSPETFWDLLCNGVDAITEIPKQRWSTNQFYHPDPQVLGTTYSKWGGFLNDVELFDPAAFGISPREASSMDPQQRLMLEVTMEAIEYGGFKPSALRGSKTGVFTGISTWDYSNMMYATGADKRLDPYAATGTALSIVANRVSYCFDFHGPSMVVDTACSSSLVAVHLGCESLLKGESEMVVAGGVNLYLVPVNALAFAKMGVLSPDGRCKAFDASANGFVRAEGAAVVVLKPLSKAIRDGDRIHAVIKTTGVDQDGVTNGLAVPNGAAQAMLIRESFGNAGLDPREVAYVEAHGTGTAVGDPTECHAIGETIGAGRDGDRCLIGSVKTNLGHLESAAGIAGLIKAALVLQHRHVPPSLHFHTPNPHIDFEALGLEVVTENRALAAEGSLLAAVNSFGFGGTNAFAVLATPPAVNQPPPQGGLHLIPISATSDERLSVLADAWIGFLSLRPELDAAAAAAALRHEHQTHRLCVVAADAAEAASRLQTFRQGERASGIAIGKPAAGGVPRIAFVFSGQGPQWFAMGRGLYQHDAVYRRKLDECDRILRGIAGWSLVEMLSASEEESRIRETAFAQPALCALQIAVAEVWKSRGVLPSATIGHSVGELAAAHVAGRLSLEETMRIVCHRGDCIQRFASHGAMLAATMAPAEAAELARAPEHEGIEIAAFNGPSSVTFAGESERIAALALALEAKGVIHQQLHVDYAFHSHLVDAAHDPFLEAIGATHDQAASVPWVSTVTEDLVEPGALNAGYWWQNVRHAVHFAQAMDKLLTQGIAACVEISPHPVLMPSITESFRAHGREARIACSLRRREDEPTAMLTALGQLHCWGCEIDWRSLYPTQRTPVTLPAYPWQHQSFWVGTTDLPWQAGRTHPILGSRMPFHKPVWRTLIDLRRLPYLAEHRLQNRALLAGTAYIDMAMAAAHEVLGVELPVLENLELRKALFLPNEPEAAELLVEYEPADRELRFFSRLSGTQTDWTMNCKLRLGPEGIGEEVPPFDREAAIARCPDSLPGEVMYEIGEATQLDYGPLFRGMKRFWRSSTEVVAEIVLPPGVEPSGGGYFFHPVFFDACIQAGNLNRPFGLSAASLQQVTFVPVGFREIRLHKKPVTRRLWVHVLKTRDTVRHQCGDVFIYDDAGEPVLSLRDFESQGVERKGIGDGSSMDDWTYELAFVPKARQHEHPVHRTLPPGTSLRVMAHQVSEKERAIVRNATRTVRFEALREKLDTLAVTWWERGFRELGLARCDGLPATVATVMQTCGVVEGLAPYARIAVTSLAHAGVLRVEESAWRVAPEPVLQTEPAMQWREIIAEFPVAGPEVTVLQILGSNMAALLTGRTTMQEQLFNRAVEGLMDHFYQDSSALIVPNVTLAKAVARMARQSPPERKFRILEVGAGTGGVTTHILSMIEGLNVEYVFTDISAAFFVPARRRHVDYGSFIDYRLLDLEKDAEAQGFTPGEFDVVVAANVIHAVPDVAKSMRHIRELLAPGGVLCLLEVVALSPMHHFIFGLTPQWWLHQNDAMQPMTCADWTRTMEQEFVEVVELSESRRGASSAMAEIAILLARTAEAPDVPGNASARPPVHASWLLLEDRRQAAAQLGARLSARGQSFRICPRDDMARALDEAIAASRPFDGVVLLSPLDCVANDALSLDSIDSDAAITWEAGLAVIQKIASLEHSVRPQIIAVTSGMQPVNGVIGDHGLMQATIRGVLSVAVCEYPALKVRNVDLDPQSPAAAQLDALVHEMLDDENEQEVAFRDGVRYVARLRRTTLSDIGGDDKIWRDDRKFRETAPRFELYVPGAGTIERLSWRQKREQVPSAGQIEVRAIATGLNFRDVLKVLGLYPMDGDYLSLGDECAGVVERVGDGVTEFRPGDEVICVGMNCYSSHVLSYEHLTMRKPERFTFEEAATVPIAFLTAHYCLTELARLQPGEWVLIHAAAGGVGLAAVQLAQRAGARIIATASFRKQAFVSLLGVEHVLDSRTTDFAAQVRMITGGRGVDVVLNSLAGEAIDKSLGILARYGRFIEIGKRDLYENRKIGLGVFRQGISFHSVDLSRVMADRPDLIARMKNELIARFDAGELHALPHRIFTASRIRDAFRTMSDAKHTGKIVIAMEQPDIRIEPAAREGTDFKQDATYLITGGSGGFGTEVARAMLAYGARHLVLLSRGDPQSEKARQALARLTPFENARIVMLQADVADRSAMERVFSRIRAEMPPLAGVVHAAGIIEDAPLAKLDAAAFRRVIAPKVFGLWNLHELTSDLPLDFFLITSSTASLLGNAGQANYAVANAFLDACAHYRHVRGLPANAVNFGPLADAGMVARDPGLVDRMARLGIAMLPMRKAVEVLRVAHLRSRPQTGAMRVRWRRWLDAFGFTHVPSKILDVVAEDDAGPSAATGSGEVMESLMSAAPEEREALVTKFVALTIARVLGTLVDKIDPTQPLHSLGLDSLSTVELCNRLEGDLQITVPLSELAKKPSANQLAAVVLQLLPQRWAKA